MSPLVHFDGWVIPAKIEEGPTFRIWSNMGRAEKKGATWGDLAVYTRTELDEVLEERAKNALLFKPLPREESIKAESVQAAAEQAESITAEETQEPIKVERVPSAAISFETYQEPKNVRQPEQKQTLRQKLDNFMKPSRPLCLGCGKYCVNSKPPDSWNAADRKRYCCLGCRDSHGKKHADRCQKHKPL